MASNQIIAGILFIIGIGIFIYSIIGGFNSQKIDNNGYSIINIEEYKKGYSNNKYSQEKKLPYSLHLYQTKMN